MAARCPERTACERRGGEAPGGRSAGRPSRAPPPVQSPVFCPEQTVVRPQLCPRAGSKHLPEVRKREDLAAALGSAGPFSPGSAGGRRGSGSGPPCGGRCCPGARLPQGLGSACRDPERCVSRAASRLGPVSRGHTFLEEHRILSILGVIAWPPSLMIFPCLPPLLSRLSSFLIQDKMFPVFLKDSFHELLLVSVCVSAVAPGSCSESRDRAFFCDRIQDKLLTLLFLKQVTTNQNNT